VYASETVECQAGEKMIYDFVIIGHGVVGKVLEAHLNEESDKKGISILNVPIERENSGYAIDKNELQTLLRVQKENLNVPTYLAVGYFNNNLARLELSEKLTSYGVRLDKYISRKSFLSSDASIDDSSIIMPGAIVEPFAKIGKGTIVWSNAHVSHHAEVGNFCFIASGAVICGASVVGNATFIGANSTIIDEVQVGENNLIGAGSIVRTSTQPNSVFVSPNSSVLENFRIPS
jgi:sugar O-acyltransferase (sialic acid O-acetyltransferase NeuD family)